MASIFFQLVFHPPNKLKNQGYCANHCSIPFTKTKKNCKTKDHWKKTPITWTRRRPNAAHVLILGPGWFIWLVVGTSISWQFKGWPLIRRSLNRIEGPEVKNEKKKLGPSDQNLSPLMEIRPYLAGMISPHSLSIRPYEGGIGHPPRKRSVSWPKNADVKMSKCLESISQSILSRKAGAPRMLAQISIGRLSNILYCCSNSSEILSFFSVDTRTFPSPAKFSHTPPSKSVPLKRAERRWWHSIWALEEIHKVGRNWC